MREILFRGRRMFGDEWVYGDLIQFGDRTFIANGWCMSVEEDEFDMFDCDTVCEVIPETIGQFTNLLDKNGNSIYEGDILEYKSYTGTGFEEINHAIVFWDEHRWSYERIYSNRWTESWNCKGYKCDIYKGTVAKYGEVIGNIHNNPELLG